MNLILLRSGGSGGLGLIFVIAIIIIVIFLIRRGKSSTPDKEKAEDTLHPVNTPTRGLDNGNKHGGRKPGSKNKPKQPEQIIVRKTTTIVEEVKHVNPKKN